MSEPTTNAAAPEVAVDASIDTPEVTQPVGNEPAPAVETAPGTDKLPKSGTVEGEIKKEENPANPEKPYTLRVDGKNYAISMEEALQLAQKGVGADSRFQKASKRFSEASLMRQQAEQFIHALKTDPMAVLNNPNLGLDFKKLAQDFLKKEIDKEMMSPEQRELEETKHRLMQAESEKKKLAQSEEEKRTQQLVNHYSGEYEKDIQATLSTSGLPKTRGTVKRMAYYMQKGLERGVELKAGDVVDLVRSDYIQEHNELYGNTDGDTLIKMFGDPVIKKLMEANLKRVKGGGKPPAKGSNGKEPEILSKPTQKLDKDEWRAQLDAKVNKL